MNLLDALYHRRAIRDYTDAPVDQQLLHSVIAAATRAPNAMNRQPWSFVVVTNRPVLDRCSARAKAHSLASLSANPHLAGYREHLASPTFNIFYNAPALIVICATQPDPMAQQDCCLAAENLMLAAHGSGLGTCWIGFAEAWLNQPEGKAELKLPAEHAPVAPIIIGHPRGEHPAPPRREPHITWIEG
ncbi:MAG: nitroreductase family protein [Stellaceae bacterium]